MDFEIGKKKKHTKGEKFVKKIKKVYEKAKMMLVELQEKMKKYADRNRKEMVEYKVRNKVLLSTKDLT